MGGGGGSREQIILDVQSDEGERDGETDENEHKDIKKYQTNGREIVGSL